MEDQAAVKSHHIKAWRISIRKGEARRVMSEVVAKAAEDGAQVLVLRSDMVFGLDHLRAAYCHARDAIEGGRGASNSISMETLLYASGERQLGAAIKKMTVDDSTQEMVVAWLGESGLEPALGWTDLSDSDPGPDVESLKKFGISAQELRTVAPGRGAELILEKGAAVDVLKK